MRKQSKIYEYINKLKEKRKKRTDKSESPFFFDFSADLNNTTDVKPQKREENCIFDPLLPRYYKGYDMEILCRKEDDECLTEEEASVLKEARTHFYRKFSTQPISEIAKKLFPAVHKGKSTFELFDKMEKKKPLTEEENAFFDELFYEYVEKPHRERAEMIEQRRIEAIKAGKFVPGPLIHVPMTKSQIWVKHTITKTVQFSKVELIQTILKMTGKEIYDIYGLKRDEVIAEVVRFPLTGFEMDIKCVIPTEETEKPWTEAVLFYEGREVAMTEPDETFFDTWELSYGDHTFTAIIVPETSSTDI